MLGIVEAVFLILSSHGSSWDCQRVNELYSEFGNMLPIRGSSFIPLSAITTISQELINIRNHNDHNSFFYVILPSMILDTSLILLLRGNLTLSLERLNRTLIQNPKRIKHLMISISQ